MPERAQILEGLTRAANDGIAIAIAWHVVIAIALFAAAAGWRPSSRRVALLLTLPLASVSLSSLYYKNSFNAAIFAGLALALVVLAALARERARVAQGWTQLAGAAMVAFGWAYPHFLVERSPVDYLFAAPLGLIPCPTLALVIGLALLVRGIDRRWCLTLALVAAFYALFGAIRLRVWLDLALLAGAIGLALATRAGRSVEPAQALPHSA